MQFVVVTLFPEMFRLVTDFGVTGRAVTRGLVSVACCNPRDFAVDRYRSVDDRPYGGGPGMVMRPEPLAAALDKARRMAGDGASVLYLSPQGRRLDFAGVRDLARRSSVVLLTGRYEGVDERILDEYVDEEWSIGDYVLSGGELAAMVMMDAIIRTIPGALGNENSAREDSFVEGLLDHDHYTRPEVFRGRNVPEVLLGGDHSAIERWRLKQSLGRTWLRRPDLLRQNELTDEQQKLLDEFRNEVEAERSHDEPD